MEKDGEREAFSMEDGETVDGRMEMLMREKGVIRKCFVASCR